MHCIGQKTSHLLFSKFLIGSTGRNQDGIYFCLLHGNMEKLAMKSYLERSSRGKKKKTRKKKDNQKQEERWAKL